MPGAKPSHFFYAVHDLARQIKRRFDMEAQHYGLTMPQWRLLGQLSRGDGVSQSALAAMIESDPMTVSGMIERLETKGLVVREADPADSRAKIVTITGPARQMVEEMKALVGHTVEEAFEGVSDQEREILIRVLARVSKNLGAGGASLKDKIKEDVK